VRRVAGLLGTAGPEAVYAAVTEELAQVADPETGAVRAEMASVLRYEPDGAVTVLGFWGEQGTMGPRSSRWMLEGDSVMARVARTGAPARVDDYDRLGGSVTEIAHELALVSTVGVPIAIEGETWGALCVYGRRPLPPRIEALATAYAQLIATAVATYDVRMAARRLADEQAALRRVATLVAHDVPREQVFGAVAEEIGRLLQADAANMVRYDADDFGTVMSWWSRDGSGAPVGSRWPAEGGLAKGIAHSGRPLRVDDWTGRHGAIAALVRDELGIRSSLGCPIVVQGKPWGLVLAHSARPQPLAAEEESRLISFAELVATAISNADAQDEVRRLAAEQAALRRVATLVAHQASPADVFDAVAQEVGRLLEMDHTRLVRYDSGELTLVTASPMTPELEPYLTKSVPMEGDSLSARMLRTGRPARMERYEGASGRLAAHVQRSGPRNGAGAPIMVAGQVWGALIVGMEDEDPLPAGLEQRLLQFAELVATAIANVEARTALAASRARIVLATDEARRRFERDLHDGAQQRIVTLALELRLAAEDMASELRDEVVHIADGLNGVLDELRELSRGLHPAILSEGGLRPALRALARRSPLKVRLRVDVGERFDDRVEVAAYYIVSEALANAGKYAGATAIEVELELHDGVLSVTVRDDGAGLPHPGPLPPAGRPHPLGGAGLIGLADRVEALAGTIEIASPPGAGTSIHAELPALPRDS
jgi:signal transduction histidine kinase